MVAAALTPRVRLATVCDRVRERRWAEIRPVGRMTTWSGALAGQKTTTPTCRLADSKIKRRLLMQRLRLQLRRIHL
jgi:hypothetical protein